VMNGPHLDMQVCNLGETLKEVELKVGSRHGHIIKHSESLIYSLHKDNLFRETKCCRASGNTAIVGKRFPEPRKSVA